MMKSFKSVGREMTKKQQQRPRSSNWVTVEYDDLKVEEIIQKICGDQKHPHKMSLHRDYIRS